VFIVFIVLIVAIVSAVPQGRRPVFRPILSPPSNTVACLALAIAMRAPAATIAIPLIAGSAYGVYTGDTNSPDISFRAAAAGLIALVAAVGAFLDDSAAECTLGVVVGTLVVGTSLGTTAASRAYRSPLLAWYAEASRAERERAVIEGVLREDAAVMATGVSLSVDVRTVASRRAGEQHLGGLRLSVAGTLATERLREWRAGRRVRVPASVREPTVYRNPGVPDERRALARRGVVLVGSVKSGALVDITARGSPIDEWASELRARARETLSSAIGFWGQRSAGVAIAIVLGDRTGLPQADERRLQDAGTYHVIAISGGNIAILTGLLLTLLRCLRAPPRLAALTAILVLLFYGRVTGSSASVDRAITAAVLYLGARLFDHRGPPLNTLAVAAILGVTVAPVAVFDPGFLLSFGATLGILVGVPRLLSAARGLTGRVMTRALTGVLALLLGTTAAELALFPLAAALFARVTFAGLILNFAAIPLMAVVQIGSIVVLALSIISVDLTRRAGQIVHLASEGLVNSSRLMEITPWLAHEVAPPGWCLLSAYYVALLTAIASLRLRIPAVALATLSGLLIVVGAHLTARDRVPLPPPFTLRVVFLDVGQGDATLVQFPGGRALLVDAGGLPAAPLQDPADGPAFDIGERVVARALRALGVSALDALVVTHGDPDHIGGGISVINRFRPRAIWEGVPVPPHQPLQALASAANHTGAEWRTAQVGDRVRLNTVEIHTLHPPRPDWERQRVRNDDSIVLAIRYGRVSFVLPGDIGREGEQAALGHFQRSPIVVVKAPHHGSATSSTQPFLDALQPRAVIVSAGRNNRFGHPAPTVVERYRAMQTEIFSTADDGAVTVETDGKVVTIRGWFSGREWRTQ
jgi:competence protein ComEC